MTLTLSRSLTTAFSLNVTKFLKMNELFRFFERQRHMSLTKEDGRKRIKTKRLEKNRTNVSSPTS